MIDFGRALLVSCSILLSGCATTSLEGHEPWRAKDAIVTSEVSIVGAWAVDQTKKGQENRAVSSDHDKAVMRRLTWRSAFVPAGTFLIWTDIQDDVISTEAYGIQVQSEIPGSGGCKSINWFNLYGVDNWKGLLAAMNGRQGGTRFLTGTLAKYTTSPHGYGAGLIIVCQTKDKRAVDLYAQHSSWLTDAMIGDPGLYVHAGVVKVSPDHAAAWFASEMKARRYIEKSAPPPPDSWEPLPEPASHKQARMAARNVQVLR